MKRGTGGQPKENPWNEGASRSASEPRESLVTLMDVAKLSEKLKPRISEEGTDESTCLTSRGKVGQRVPKEKMGEL